MFIEENLESWTLKCFWPLTYGVYQRFSEKVDLDFIWYYGFNFAQDWNANAASFQQVVKNKIFFGAGDLICWLIKTPRPSTWLECEKPLNGLYVLSIATYLKGRSQLNPPPNR